ncbi:1-deoxy-D-xylulose-5-phosphate synthase, partial [Vibrio parahaemolyticus]
MAFGLGTVELTVSLHYVYNTPVDKLIWDVGHQAFPYKILTGRRDQIPPFRPKAGLDAFPWREQTEYRTLSVGHSSTSISAGLGRAINAHEEGKGCRVISVSVQS